MSEIATLGLRIEDKDAKLAATSLDTLAASAKKTESAYASLELRAKMAGGAFSGMSQKEMALAIQQTRTVEIAKNLGVVTAQAGTAVATAGTKAVQSAVNFGRLREGMNGLLSSVIPLPPGLNQLSSSLGSMALGSGLMVAVMAGVAALGFAWRKLTEDVRKAKEEHVKLVGVLEEVGEKARLGATGLLGMAMAAGNLELSKVTEKLASARSALAGMDTEDKRHQLFEKRVMDSEAAEKKIVANIKAASAEITRIHKEGHDKRAKDAETALNERLRREKEALDKLIALRMEEFAHEQRIAADARAWRERFEASKEQRARSELAHDESVGAAGREWRAKFDADNAAAVKAFFEQWKKEQDAATEAHKKVAATSMDFLRNVAANAIAQLGQMLTTAGVNSGSLVLGGGAGMLAGAATGAIAGSVIPGVGTALGAAAGALTGLVTGLIGAASAIRRASEAQKQHTRAVEEQTKAMEKQRREYKEDLDVRLLNAAGMTREAEALRREIAQRRELEGVTDAHTRSLLELIHAFENATAEMQEWQAAIGKVKAESRDRKEAEEQRLRDAKEAEDQRLRDAEQRLRDAKAFADSLRARELSLGGDVIGRLQLQQEAEFAAAKALYDAGTITLDMLMRWVAVLNGELNTAIAEQVAAARQLAEANRQAAEASRLAAIAEERRHSGAGVGFELDLTARERALGGDVSGAEFARLLAQQAAALLSARELMEQGTITGEMFSRLARILQGELDAALTAIADEAARAALAEHERVEALRAQNVQMREDLQVRGLRAAGRDAEADSLTQALGRQREYAQAVRDGADAQSLAMLAQVQAAEAARRLADETRRLADEARRAAEELAAAAREAVRMTEDLNIRLLRATGGGAGSEDLEIAARHRRETEDAGLAGRSREYMALLALVHAAELSQIADQRAAAEQAAATAAQLSTLDQQLDVARDQLRAQEQAVAETRRVVESLAKFSAGLRLSGLSTLSPVQQLEEARRQYEAQHSSAMGGNRDAAMGLPDAARALLEASRTVNASGMGYVRDFQMIEQSIAATQDLYGRQLSTEERILAELILHTSAFEAQIAVLRGIADREGITRTPTGYTWDNPDPNVWRQQQEAERLRARQNDPNSGLQWFERNGFEGELSPDGSMRYSTVTRSWKPADSPELAAINANLAALIAVSQAGFQQTIAAVGANTDSVDVNTKFVKQGVAP